MSEVLIEQQRHLELMAATIAAGFVAHGFQDSGGGPISWNHTEIPARAVAMAQAIQRLTRGEGNG